jgi:YegS/Rv2252/BmrU family lipid kinase
MDRILVILNPAARGEKAGMMINKIAQLSHRILIRLTTMPGEARGLAREAVAEGRNIVVAAGGDGTINEVVNGIAGSDVRLGLLPAGTMNVFAAELGLPGSDLRKCWQIIETGRVRHVDLPRADGQYFVQLAGIGLDAQTVQETTYEFKKNFGPLSYLISATQIAARKPPRLIVETPERTEQGSFVLVGNGRFYGGPFEIFKQAKIDDGRLDVLIFKNLGYLDIVRYLNAIVFGTHTALADVAYFQTSTLTVRSEERVPVEVDGEVIGEVPVTFGFASQKLQVFAP